MHAATLATMLQRHHIPVLRYCEPTAHCDGEIAVTSTIQVQVPLGQPLEGLAVLVVLSEHRFELSPVCRNFKALLKELRAALAKASANCH